MACARRSLTSNFTILARRFHPSLSHLLPSERRSDEIASDSRPPVRNHCFGHSGGLNRERSGFGFGQSFRSYSSNSGDSRDVGFIRDVTSMLAENGTDSAQALTDNSLEITQAAVTTAIGEVAAAAADSAPPVAALQYVIDGVHSLTGFNWWGSIIVTTLIIRCCTAPLMIHQLKATSKLAVLRPQMEELKEQMENMTDPILLQEKQKQFKQLFKKHGVSPFTPVKGLLIQGPVFISFYLAISNMVEKVPSFKEGGAFWFTDLTIPDPFYALPILTGLSFLITVELNMQEGMEANPMASNMKKFSRLMAFLTVPFTANFPQAIFCYWITSNLYSLVYGMILKRPPVRKYLNLPEIPSHSTPASQSSTPLPFLEGSNQNALRASSPLTNNQQSQTADRRISSSSVISQRIRKLEKTVKGRGKSKKR